MTSPWQGEIPRVAIRQPVVPPLYESKDGYTIARDLAKKLKLVRIFPCRALEDKIKGQCKHWNLSYDELSTKGFISIPIHRMPTSRRKINRPSERSQEDRAR